MYLKGVIEGILFVVGSDGVTVNDIKNIVNMGDQNIVILLEELQHDYQSEDRGIQIEKFGDRYKLVTKKEHLEYYQKMINREKNSELTQSSLETLAIIAYNQPITRIKVEEIRGVSCKHSIRKLLVQGLIKECGKSELPGRPMLYGVTDDFLDYLGIKSLDELPTLTYEQLEEEEQDIFESKYKETE